jgi:hypothetical protein
MYATQSSTEQRGTARSHRRGSTEAWGKRFGA